ncbi:VanZ family protein [Robertmurraya korlensis]|uniref:VanZ family protein n=1 Tax=Robertmurraya korlensis TaxID=519977 RepID=UPI0008251B29|nr:VanZ family protein [Robertmurraya korlensis]
MKYRKLKWLTVLVPIFSLTFASLQLENGSLFFEYFTVFGNWILLTTLALWFINKSTVRSTWDLLFLSSFIFYLFVLHHYVSYIDIGYYFTQEYLGNHHIQFEQINFIPLKTIVHTFTNPVLALVTIIQIVGNILLLTPFSFALLSLNITKSFKKTVIITMFISIGIETIQFIQGFIISGYMFGDGRAVDIDDVILNTLGGLTGAVFYKLYKRFILNNLMKRNQLSHNT